MTKPALSQREASDPRASVWVSASAGTGKTKVLTDRVLNLLLEGTPPQRLLCLTFTKAAAAEMATRLADRLGRWSMLDDAPLRAELEELSGTPPDGRKLVRARRLFAQVLDAPGGIRIETIHAFCQSVLRRFPLEARVPPHFSVMDERRAGENLTSARETLLAQARSGVKGDLAAAVTTVAGLIPESKFPDLLSTLTGERSRLRRLIERCGAIDRAQAEIRRFLGVKKGETPESIYQQACSGGAIDSQGLRLAVKGLREGSEKDRGRAMLMGGWLVATPENRRATLEDYAGLFLTKDLRKIRARLATNDAIAAVPGLDDILENEAHRLLLAVHRHRAATLAQATGALVHLGAALLGIYEDHKRSHALLDYDDLILITRDLLRRPGVAPWVLFKLDGGLDHLLIDEAQDTNPEQWEVVKALTTEFFTGEGHRSGNRTVFAVGDAKQSIYSFQRADPAGFEKMRGFFRKRVPLAKKTWREVELSVSFRSTRAVLEAVDAVFAAPAARDGVVPETQTVAHTSWRGGDGGVVEIWPLVEPRDEDPAPAWKPPVERGAVGAPRTRLAQRLARHIDRMIGTDILESKGRPVQAGDLMVLVRRRGAFVEDFVRELKRRDIPVAGADRMVLTEQIAVMDLIALGDFLLLLEDDLTLASVLKSPLVGFDEEALFDLAHGRSGGLWAELSKRRDDNAVFTKAYDFLSGLLKRADRTPPFELFAHILGPLKGRRKLVARLGREAEDPINEFMSQAEAFEQTHPPSLQGFLHWLRAGHPEIKRDLEDVRDAVRVMTVHGAKGLQAPIVFLPDTVQAPRMDKRLFWAGEAGQELPVWIPLRDLADPTGETVIAHAEKMQGDEYRRLLYVAMTRAEDRLYVCGWKSKHALRQDSWYGLVSAALQAHGEDLGDGVLRLTSAQERVVENGASPPRPHPPPALPDWIQRPPPDEPTPPKPLAPSRPQEEEPPILPPLADGGGARFRRGRLAHQLLQVLPEIDAKQRRSAARAYLRRYGEEGDVETLSDEIMGIMENPKFAALFGPDSRAEVPIAGLIGDYALSGRMDRLVVARDRIQLVEYKTDRQVPPCPQDVPSAYLRQMATYRAALRTIFPDRQVSCLLLWTDGPCLMPLPEALLDAKAP